MLREAFQYIVGLGERLKTVEVQEIDGRIFTNQSLHEISADRPSALTVNNLSGLVDYLKSNYDAQPPVLIQVKSPTEVNVFSTFDRQMNRRHLLQAKALLPEIPFDKFLLIEAFNVLLQSCFVESEQRAQVLAVVGNIREENVSTFGDDGTSQQVTAKAGVATVAQVPVPNPVILKPFRTFVDIEQPASKFVLRLKDGPSAALFEADGGQWKLDAIHDISDYLEKLLADEITSKYVTIIA